MIFNSISCKIPAYLAFLFGKAYGISVYAGRDTGMFFKESTEVILILVAKHKGDFFYGFGGEV